MTRVMMLVVVLLGNLTGCAEYRTMDGEAVGRVSLEVAGFILTAFLLFLGLSGAIAGLSRKWRLRKMKWAMRHRSPRTPQIRH